MATQQDILQWLQANPQATDRDIAAVANAYGVDPASFAAATGGDAASIADRYAVANAQNYIDTQWSDPLMQMPGNQDQRNWGILGATQQMGLTDDQQARALGWTPEAVQGFEQKFAPQVGAYQDIYKSDLMNPAPYMKPVIPTSNPASTLGMQPAGAQPGQPAAGAGPAPFGATPANPMGPGQGTFSQMYGGYQASPWLSATADEIGRRTQDALGQSFNGIRSNAVGVGGLGGSRQGVAQGQAISGAMDSLQGNLANLFGADWTGAQNRGLQKYGMDQNAYLTGRGQDMSMFNTNRSLDLQQLGLGANIYDMGVRGGWAPLTTAGGLFNQTAGNNTTTTSGGTQGGGFAGAAGGLLAGGALAQQAGWWNPWK